MCVQYKVNTYVCVRVLVLYVLYGCKRSEAIKSPSPCYLLLRGKCLTVAGDVGDGWVAGGEGGLGQEWGVPDPGLARDALGRGRSCVHLCPF